MSKDEANASPKDAALRLALEALQELEDTNSYWWQEVDEVTTKKIDPAITAIKAALETKDEPVAWRTFDGEGGYDYRTYENNEDYANDWDKRNPKHKGWVEPLYTTPSQRKPLTEKQIKEALADMSALQMPLNKLIPAIARAIEAAHGIKEEA